MCDIVQVCHAALMMKDEVPLTVSVNVKSDWSSYLNPTGVYIFIIAVHTGTLLRNSSTSSFLGGAPFVRKGALVIAIQQHAAAATGGNS